MPGSSFMAERLRPEKGRARTAYRPRISGDRAQSAARICHTPNHDIMFERTRLVPMPRARARARRVVPISELVFGALTQNRSSLEDAPPRAVAIELRIGARFRHYLATSPAFSVTRTSTMRRSVVFRHCCHICRHSSTSRRSAQSGSPTN